MKKLQELYNKGVSKQKEFFKIDLKTKDSGFVEYFFATIAVLCALPSVIAYFTLTLLVLSPVKALVSKVWK